MYDFNTLEFNKILNLLIKYVKTSYAKDIIIKNDIDYSYEAIIKRQKELNDALKAENIEFTLLWMSSYSILNNY